MSGLSAVCPAHNYRQFPSSVQVRVHNLLKLSRFIHIFTAVYVGNVHKLFTFPAALYLFFSATWNTLINSSVGMLSNNTKLIILLFLKIISDSAMLFCFFCSKKESHLLKGLVRPSLCAEKLQWLMEKNKVLIVCVYLGTVCKKFGVCAGQQSSCESTGTKELLQCTTGKTSVKVFENNGLTAIISKEVKTKSDLCSSNCATKTGGVCCTFVQYNQQ